MTSDVMLAVINCVQVLGLAYLAIRQAQVKRDLNGHERAVRNELHELRQVVGAPEHPPGPETPLRAL